MAVKIFIIIFASLLVGFVVVLLLPYLQNGISWVSVALLIFLVALLGKLVYSGIITARTITVTGNDIRAEYKFLKGRNATYTIDDCNGYFSYTRQTFGRGSDALGIILRFSHGDNLKISGEELQKEKMDKVLEILKNKGIKNYNLESRPEFLVPWAEYPFLSFFTPTDSEDRRAQKAFISDTKNE